MSQIWQFTEWLRIVALEYALPGRACTSPGLQACGNPAGGKGSSHNILVSLHGNQWLTGMRSKPVAGSGLMAVCTWLESP